MNGTKRNLAGLAVAGLAAFALSPVGDAKPAVEVELEEARVFIEWNSTDSDFGIHFFWDGDPWKRMKVTNHAGRTFLDIVTSRNLKAQGLTEGFFESAEPDTSELSMEEFLERFPEGEYEFTGETLEGEVLEGEADFVHTLPAPPTGLSPGTGDTVSRLGFTVSFDAVTEDVDGNPIDVAYYEVIVEKLEEDPILQDFKVILRPSQTSVDVPAGFLESGTEYKVEIIAVLEGGNRTISETDAFTTD